MRRLPAIVVLFALAGCGGTAPTAPAVRADEFEPPVREQVAGALERLSARPDDAAANGALAMLLHARGRHAAAAAWYARAQALDAADPRWPYLRGVALEASGDLEAAVEAFRGSLANRPGAAAAVRLGEALGKLGRAAESRAAFERAVALDPGSAAAYFGLGRAVAADADREEAPRLLARAAELAPDSGAVRYALGSLLHELGREAEAREALAAAERLGRRQPPLDDPFLREVDALRRDEHWLLNEGRRLDARGRWADSVALYREAIERAPGFGPAYANLVGALGRLGRADEAEAVYRRGAEVAPGLEELHNNWAAIEARRGRLAEAERALRRALEANPDSADALFNLGSLLAERGREADAVRHFQRAAALAPDHSGALSQLAARQVDAGDIEGGVALLERALGPDERGGPGVLYALAEAHWRAGRRDRALDFARRALAAAQRAGDRELAEAVARDLRAHGVAP